MNEYGYISPEKVYLKLNLAGVGSRFAAFFIDTLFQSLLVGSLVLAVFMGRFSTQWMLVLILLLSFVIVCGYYILFETMWNGQTPGKRFIKLRVVQQNGSSVTFLMIVIRNLLRIVDGLPLHYAIGIISIFLSKKNQRLGDMVAGTVVVREIGEDVPTVLKLELTEVPGVRVTSLNIRKIEEVDFSVLKKYLMRRESLEQEEVLVMDQKLAIFFGKKLGLNPDEIETPAELLKQIAVVCSQGAIEQSHKEEQQK